MTASMARLVTHEAKAQWSTATPRGDRYQIACTCGFVTPLCDMVATANAFLRAHVKRASA